MMINNGSLEFENGEKLKVALDKQQLHELVEKANIKRDGHQTMWNVNEKEEKVFNVYTTRGITIPSRHEVLIEGTIFKNNFNNIEEDSVVMFTPTRSEEGILAAHAIYNIRRDEKDTKIAVKLINVSDEDYHIKNNQLLGRLEEVMSIEEKKEEINLMRAAVGGGPTEKDSNKMFGALEVEVEKLKKDYESMMTATKENLSEDQWQEVEELLKKHKRIFTKPDL